MVVEEDLAAWSAGLDGLFARVAGRFFRPEPRRRARAYVRGLLAPLAGKNGWTLAEVAGDATPDGMQRLLNSANWDVDGVRDDLRGYVVEHDLATTPPTPRPHQPLPATIRHPITICGWSTSTATAVGRGGVAGCRR